MSAFKYQWNQTIDVGTAGLLSKQWTSIRHILSLLVTANACVHVTAYVAVRRSLSTTYTAVVLGLLLRQYVSYQFGVWAGQGPVSLRLMTSQFKDILNHTKNKSPQDAHFAVYRFKILCKISKVPFAFSHTIFNPYTTKYLFYEVLKAWRIMIFRIMTS